MLRSFSNKLFLMMIILFARYCGFANSKIDLYSKEGFQVFFDKVISLHAQDDSLKLYLDSVEQQLRDSGEMIYKNIPWQFHYIRGYNYGQTGDTEKAFEHFDYAFKIGWEQGNLNWQMQTELGAGNIYYRMGYNRMAGKKYEQALIKAQKLKNKEVEYMTLQNLGIIYKLRKKFDKSLDYFQKAEKIRLSQGRESELGNFYNNLGTLFNEMGDFKESLIYYLKAEKILLEHDPDNKIVLSKVYNNLGNHFMQNAEDEKAKRYFEKSLKLKEEDSPGFITTLGNLGLLYIETDNEKAFSYIDSAIETSEKYDYKQNLAVIYKSLMEYYESNEDYSKALYYLNKRLDVMDSLYTEEKEAQFEDIKEFFDLEEKTGRLKILQFQKTNNEERLRLNRIYIIIELIVIALSLLGIILINIRMNHRKQEIKEMVHKNKELEDKREKQRIVLEMYQKLQNQLKERINEEIEHIRDKDTMIMIQSRHSAMGEMIGNIAHQWRQPINAIGIIIQNFVDAFEYEELNDEYFKKKTGIIHDLIEYMGQTIEDFKNFFHPVKDNEVFDAAKILSRAIEFVSCTFQARNIDYKLNIKDEVMLFGISNEFFQVIINILNNAKDAFQLHKNDNPYLYIELGKMNASAGYLKIQDNAGGIEPEIIETVFDPYITTKESVKGTGMGLYIAKHIVEMKFNGEISVSNKEEGACFLIKFPAADSNLS